MIMIRDCLHCTKGFREATNQHPGQCESAARSDELLGPPQCSALSSGRSSGNACVARYIPLLVIVGDYDYGNARKRGTNGLAGPKSKTGFDKLGEH